MSGEGFFEMVADPNIEAFVEQFCVGVNKPAGVAGVLARSLVRTARKELGRKFNNCVICLSLHCFCVSVFSFSLAHSQVHLPLGENVVCTVLINLLQSYPHPSQVQERLLPLVRFLDLVLSMLKFSPFHTRTRTHTHTYIHPHPHTSTHPHTHTPPPQVMSG